MLFIDSEVPFSVASWVGLYISNYGEPKFQTSAGYSFDLYA